MKNNKGRFQFLKTFSNMLGGGIFKFFLPKEARNYANPLEF